MDKTYTILEATKASESYTPPVQSADTLFHFVKKLDYLLPAIEKEALVPRYCVENIEYLNIPFKEIAYPMLCFCDINLHKINEHIQFYGGYGIAFSKHWGIQKGIQPIQYINPLSHLNNDFTEAFQSAIKREDTDPIQDFLLSQMYYLKPIEGEMQRDGGLVHKNFTDECEWRFVPDLSTTGFPNVLYEAALANKLPMQSSYHTINYRYSSNSFAFCIISIWFGLFLNSSSSFSFKNNILPEYIFFPITKEYCLYQEG